MTRMAKPALSWTVCCSCGSVLQAEHFWVDDDGLLCRECVKRRRVDCIRRSRTGCGAKRKGIRSLITVEAGVAC